MNNNNEHICRDIKYLITKLLHKRRFYFDKNYYLNSEGMKILIEITRLINRCFPHYRNRVRDIMRNPSIEKIVKFAEDICGGELIESMFHGPYSYSFDI